MQVPLLTGIKGSEQAEFARVYPLNLEPVVIDTKISKGQLRAAAGVRSLTSGPGIDRGGILWNDTLLRVMGTRLVQVSASGAIVDLGDVGPGGPVNMDYGFDRLAINSGDRLYYWNGTSLTQVTDVDLGPVLDMIWVDGYYMTTDGTSIVVTELSDPTSVDPLKYGSAEEDPDMVTGLAKLRGEVCAIGRYTIEFLRNQGGNGFPFVTIPGATIPYGCVSASAKTIFAENIAFVGSARDEALGVYLSGQGTAEKLSTREVDDAIAAVADPTAIVLEKRVYRDEQRLIVHLPTESWAFLLTATRRVGEPVWYRLQSGVGRPYRPRFAIQAYGKIIVGDAASAALGVLDETISDHFGETVQWEFLAGLLYNEARGGIIQSVELVGLPGRGPVGEEGRAFLSMTRDGETYSIERPISMGGSGQRQKRMQWRPQTKFENWLGLRFRGYNRTMPGFAAIEASIEGLAA